MLHDLEDGQEENYEYVGLGNRVLRFVLFRDHN